MLKRFFFIWEFEWMQPRFFFPTTLQRLIFKLVECDFVICHQSCFQCAKPVVMFPAKCDETQSAPGQLGKWVVRNRLAPVQKKWNFIARKNPPQCIVIAIELSENHCDFAKAS